MAELPKDEPTVDSAFFLEGLRVLSERRLNDEKDDRNFNRAWGFICRSQLFRVELGGTSHDAHGGSGNG